MSAERWIHVSFYSRLTLQNTVYKDIYSPCQNMAGNPKLFCMRKIRIPLRKHLLVIPIGGEARAAAIPILQHLNFLQTLTVRATSSSRFRRMRNLEQKKKIATYNTSRLSLCSIIMEIPSGVTFMPEHFSNLAPQFRSATAPISSLPSGAVLAPSMALTCTERPVGLFRLGRSQQVTRPHRQNAPPPSEHGDHTFNRQLYCIFIAF